ALALHLRSCALCGEALAVSAELAGEADAPEHRTAPLRSRWTRLGAGAVTLAALAVGFTLMHLQRGTPPEAGELRGPVATSIRALSGGEQARSAIRLAWAPVEGAVRYRVQVSGADRQALYDRTVEQDTSLSVPPSLGASSILRWRVDAQLPDGRTMTSQTFTVRLV